MRIVLAMALATGGCGHSIRTCDSNVDFVYRDTSCGSVSPGDPVTCQEVGDGLCHLRCSSDGDCPAFAPNCHVLGLFQGGDFKCNGSVRVCGQLDRDECPR